MATPRDAVGLGRAAVRLLEPALEAFIAACVSGIIAVVLAGVIWRYVLNASLTWTDELARLLFLYLIFAGLPLAVLRGDQLALTAVREMAAPALRRTLELVAESIEAFALVMLAMNGAALVRLIHGSTAALEVPTWVIYASIAPSALLGLACLPLQALRGGLGWVRVLSPVAVGLAGYLAIEAFDVVRFPGTSPSLIMIGFFVLTLAIGVPIALGMLASVFMAMIGGDLLPGPAVVQNTVSGAGKYLLLAIPLFLATGTLMNASGLSNRLMDLAHALVGHFRGGLAQVNVMNSLLFGGISGSSTSDAALDSKILVPQMVRNGYRAEFSCAITAAAAVLPNVIPPSIAILIFAAIADESVAKLFIAAILPGLLLAACLMATVFLIARTRGYGRAGPRASARQLTAALARAAPVLLIIVMVVLGLRFGVITPTECGVVAVVWILLLWRILSPTFSLSEIYAALRQCAFEGSTIGLLIGVATPFAFVLISEQMPQRFVAAVMGGITQPWLVLLLMNVMMLLAGTVLNVSASMLILLPLFLPTIAAIGVDPVHFGLIVVVNLLLGGITPPVGILVYITSTISKTPLQAVFREVMPFFVAMLVALAIITYIPALTVGVVRLAF